MNDLDNTSNDISIHGYPQYHPKARVLDGDLHARIAELEAENQRLRAALVAIAEFHIPEARNDYHLIARAALSEEPA